MKSSGPANSRFCIHENSLKSLGENLLHKISPVSFFQLNIYICIMRRGATYVRQAPRRRARGKEGGSARRSPRAERLKIRRPSKQIPFRPDPGHTVNLVITRRAVSSRSPRLTHHQRLKFPSAHGNFAVSEVPKAALESLSRAHSFALPSSITGRTSVWLRPGASKPAFPFYFYAETSQ